MKTNEPVEDEWHNRHRIQEAKQRVRLFNARSQAVQTKDDLFTLVPMSASYFGVQW